MPILYLAQFRNKNSVPSYLTFSPKLREITFSEGPIPPAREVISRPYRTSPVFPVLPTESLAPGFSGQTFLGFFAYDRAFSAIGRLLRQLPPDMLPNMWFSHGFASLLIFERAKDRLSIPELLSQSDLRAWEIWTLNDNVVHHQIDCFVAPPADVSIPSLEIDDFTALPSDLRQVLSEFSHCIYTALERSAHYYPGYIRPLCSLIESINYIISEIQFLGNTNPGTDQNFPSYLRDNPISRQKRLNQRTDQIIQLNSALSYVISQSFAGTIPILERECQVQSYSLLGIGTASLALFRFSEFVQNVFMKHPIDMAIEKKFPSLEGTNIFPSMRDFRPATWDHADFHIDTHLAGIETPPFRPKLVFYSGRLGFKEAEFSVTAALQVIFGSDSARWSLMTLTHELMHAHVRALLSAILKATDDRELEKDFARYYSDLYAYHKRKAGRWKLIQSVRSMILNFFVQKRACEEFMNGSAKTSYEATVNQLDVRFPENPDALRQWMREDFRDLNEIMVHVCDYHYFYNSNDELYLGLLWESWSTVPSVLSEIDHYVFRSLVAVATKEPGEIKERFDLSLRILTQNLEQILDRRPQNPVVECALTFLRDPNRHGSLLLRFIPALYLAEVTLKFLVSGRIQAELVSGDSNFEVEKGEYIYHIETGEFPGFDISSPVGFLADRLRRSLRGISSSVDEEHASAWVLLACASVDGSRSES